MKNNINILGVYPNDNASACLVSDGKIIAVGEEERFNRIKTTNSLPLKSIKYVLSEAGISLDDVNYISVAWNCKKYPDFMDENILCLRTPSKNKIPDSNNF